MGVSVDHSLVERVLRILREGGAYQDVRQGLDEFFPQGDWAENADGHGPFTLAFTRNAETEGGWLPQQDLDAFWHAAALADPEQASGTDELHSVLQRVIAGWRSAPAAAAATPEAGAADAAFQSVTDMPGEHYAGWKQGYDPAAGVWKYRDPGDGQWKQNHEAFPLVADGSRIFRIGQNTFLAADDGDRQVWPDPATPDTYYDSTGHYDRLGDPAAPAAAHEPVDEAALEQEMRALFDIPPDSPVWISAP